MHLDLGQSNVGVTKCSECGMEYVQSREEEQKLHKKYHASFIDAPSFMVSRLDSFILLRNPSFLVPRPQRHPGFQID